MQSYSRWVIRWCCDASYWNWDTLRSSPWSLAAVLTAASSPLSSPPPPCLLLLLLLSSSSLPSPSTHISSQSSSADAVTLLLLLLFNLSRQWLFVFDPSVCSLNSSHKIKIVKVFYEPNKKDYPRERHNSTLTEPQEVLWLRKRWQFIRLS